MSYKPNPLNTSHQELSPEILKLTELLAQNAHAVWSQERLAEGWRYGSQRDDAKKEHPCLVSYEKLPESEKEYDRKIVLQTLKTILALGYKIEKKA